MRVLILATAFLGALSGVAPASADPGSSASPYAPPFVDHAEWTQWNQLSSLRVYPTRSGRDASRDLGSSTPAVDEAWAEVLALAPTAATPGMRQQFQCHWEFAESAQPGKVSWNLEPWRPVVDDATMVSSGCNPGGGHESF
jgi:Protein of unknown function (DUF2599)